MKKFLLTTLMATLLAHTCAWSFEYGQWKSCITEEDFKLYFMENIKQLDPLEGIYNVSEGFICGSLSAIDDYRRELTGDIVAIVKDSSGLFHTCSLNNKEISGVTFIGVNNKKKYRYVENEYDLDYKFAFDGNSFEIHPKLSSYQKKRINPDATYTTCIYRLYAAEKCFPSSVMVLPDSTPEYYLQLSQEYAKYAKECHSRANFYNEKYIQNRTNAQQSDNMVMQRPLLAVYGTPSKHMSSSEPMPYFQRESAHAESNLSDKEQSQEMAQEAQKNRDYWLEKYQEALDLSDKYKKMAQESQKAQ